MKIGAASLTWVPDSLTLPRPFKSFATKENYGGVAVMDWPPLVAGQVVKAKWEVLGEAQYQAIRGEFLAGSVAVLDLSSDSVAGEKLHVEPSGGQTALKYNVLIQSVESKYLEVVDTDAPYRVDVTVEMVVRSVAA